MSDYDSVERALSQGVSPAMLCMTCPWDRYYIMPPSMTRADIDERMAEAQREDDERVSPTGEKTAFPVGQLLSAMLFAGKDKAAEICPVFSLRLKSSGGRRIADEIKDGMQRWDDAS